ncbi:MAG TPA: 4'-phosphopantetheinyl transferase superfamily protein [Polyangiaceae bacterium]|nr:4'-phosphopantetheinyl transferase superfamily protein [Polyangiaceae bacterium]
MNQQLAPLFGTDAHLPYGHRPAALGKSANEVEVDVYFADAREWDTDAIGRASTLLAIPELERAKTYYFERDRQSYIAAHALLRSRLASRLGRPASEVVIGHTPQGKPELAELTADSCHFSLSHSGPFVACAVARSPLGLDVERWRQSPPSGVPERCLSPAEYSDVMCSPPYARGERFLRYWTLKEAYIKALGRDLRVPFSEIEFRLARGSGVQLVRTPSLRDSSTSSSLTSLCFAAFSIPFEEARSRPRANHPHPAALAVLTERPIRIRCHSVDRTLSVTNTTSDS